MKTHTRFHTDTQTHTYTHTHTLPCGQWRGTFATHQPHTHFMPCTIDQAPARHGGTDQSHVTGGGLSTAAGGSSALPHLTGTAPPYKGHVFDSIPEAPIPSFRNQPSSGGSSAAGSQQPLMATQEVPSVP